MIINKFILHIFHCLVYLETVCLCVSSILSSKSLHGREFLGLWSRGQKSSTMKYDRIPDDEQKQTPLNFFPSSSPFLPQTRHYFYQEKFASQPPPAKKRYTTLKKKKERKKRSYQPFLGLLCNYVLGRDAIENTFLEPLSPPVLEIIPRKQYHFSMYRFLRYWKETPMFAIVSLNLGDFQVERKSGLTKFWRR